VYGASSELDVQRRPKGAQKEPNGVELVSVQPVISISTFDSRLLRLEFDSPSLSGRAAIKDCTTLRAEARTPQLSFPSSDNTFNAAITFLSGATAGAAGGGGGAAAAAAAAHPF
jgi:hypothetical protein